MRTRIALNLAAILLLVGLTAYVQRAVTDITETFASIRVSDAKFFSKLIRENWDGIRTIPDEKKKLLLENLDPALATVDLQTMRTLMLFTFYVFMGGAVVGRVVALYILWKKSRGNRVAT
jgi:hypothetical protein